LVDDSGFGIIPITVIWIASVWDIDDLEAVSFEIRRGLVGFWSFAGP
jgi:hypothetical protein